MQNSKYHIVHIHTDYKFVRGSAIYSGEYFENTIILIENGQQYNGALKDEVIILGHTAGDIKKIINICMDADLVIMYDLDKLKSKIILRLPNHIRIAWRFFGYELYGKLLSDYNSKQTALSLSIQKKHTSRKISDVLKICYNLMRYGRLRDGLFYNSIKRISYFLALSKEEYDDLNKKWRGLPEFIKLPLAVVPNHPTTLNLSLKSKEENPIVIIGNSKSVYNNHLDILDLIEKDPNKFNFNFTILFNYGSENSYTQKVRQLTRKKNYYNLIEEFIPFEKFDLIYQEATALVINGYRQMALYNIFVALRSGVKVYLNEKNIILDWLRREGFYLFNIEDFINDLKSDNMKLDNEMAQKNFNHSVYYTNKYTNLDYQKVLYQKLLTDQSLLKGKKESI